MKMRTNLVASMVVAGLACLGTQQTASAAPLLAVDFQAGSNTQSGFTAMTASSAVISGYTVTLSGTAGNTFFDRPAAITDSGALTYGSLYSDFVFNNTSGATMTMSIANAGITAGTPYNLTFYSFDRAINFPTTTRFTPVAATTLGPVGTVSYTTSLPTSNAQYSTTIQVTSISGGLLQIDATAFKTSDNSAFVQSLRINGFELNAVATPEPTSALLMLFAVVGVLRFRRRQLLIK